MAEGGEGIEDHRVRPRRRMGIIAAALILTAFVFASSGPAMAATDGMVRMTLKEGQSLRDLAQQHLGDPNLWIEILKASGLASVADARPGVELRIPVTQVSRAGKAVASALDHIQAATQAGAKVFASDQIDEAVSLHEQAQARRQAGDWEAAIRLAGGAERAADKALETATKARDAAVEALLSDRQGQVEGRRPRDLDWGDRPVKSTLTEEERVRTLSRSTAQITFRDESRLRLSANSEAVIMRMRADPLERAQEAKVNLIEGDFYALLAGKSRRKTFELEIPDVDTQINSTNFWVERDRRGSKFTNYDDATLEVASNGASVTLGRNEGTVVRVGQTPSDTIGVLAKPELVSPADDGTIFNAGAVLAWNPVPDATGYWLEVGQDSVFQQVLTSRWGLQQNRMETAGLGIGSYYWRVAALDKFGLPGERSETWRFNIRTDIVPPYLAIAEPADAAVLRETPVVIRGTTEPDALLSFRGETLKVAADGSFETRIVPRQGINEIAISAVDPAGNRTERTRAFVHTPADKAAVVYDPGLPRLGPLHFVTNRSPLMLSGTTEANARIGVRSSTGPLRASAFSDAAGRFVLTVPLADQREDLTLSVTASNGVVTEDGFQASIDREAPRIQPDAEPPPVTGAEWLTLSGRVEPDAQLTLNGKEIANANGHFEERVQLVAGLNRVEMQATDRVGNTGIERWQVSLDQDPPELVGQRIEPKQVERGGRLTVEVTARDRSGLRQAAQVTVAVGKETFTDYLRLSEGSGIYRGTLTLPAGARGAAVLKDVLLEDYVGNGRRYRFD
jgi:hypothetical protein